MTGWGLPTSLWGVPLAAAFLVRFLPDARARHAVVLAATAIDLALAVAAAWAFREGAGAVTQAQAWALPGAGGLLAYRATVDAGNALFLPLTALLGLLVGLYGLRLGEKAGMVWHGSVLSLLGCVMGQLVAADLLVYTAFAAAEIAPMVRLVGRWGTGRDRRAAARQVGWSLGFAALCGLAAAVTLGLLHTEQTGVWSTDVAALAEIDVPPRLADGVLWLLVVALGTRAALFPFHAWLMPATSEGPVVGLSVLLLGVKVGLAGFLRLVWPVLPEAMAAWSGVLLAMGAAGLVHGSLLALGQTDLRRMLGHFSVAHTGFVALGLFSGEVHGVSGALLEAFNLGVASAGLYFAAGFLWLRAGTTGIDEVRAYASAMPRFGLVFLVTALTAIGMPGTLGFEAMHLEIEGSVLDRAWGLALMEGGGTLLFALVLLSWYQRLFLSAEGDRGAVEDLRPPELAIALALTGLVLVGGLHPTPWVEAVEHDVAALLGVSLGAHEAVEHSAAPTPPTGGEP